MSNIQQEKSKATSNRNQAARAALRLEQAKAMRSARQALQNVFENPDATPEQILEAARLLVSLGNR